MKMQSADSARLILLWAFVESGIGGILHALKIPFSGLFLAGVSMICVTMLFHQTRGRWALFYGSCVSVLLIKLLVSPQSGPNAFIAISFQMLFGFAWYRLIGIGRLSMLAFFVIGMLQSAFQKLLVLYVLFGKALVDSVVEFETWVFSLFGLQHGSFPGLILVYVVLYVMAAVFWGSVGFRIWRDLQNPSLHAVHGTELDVRNAEMPRMSRRNKWLVFSFLLVLSLLLSWLTKSWVVLRTIAVLGIWLGLVLPWFRTWMEKLLNRQDQERVQSLQQTIALFPMVSQVMLSTWSTHQQLPLHHRMGVWVYEIFIYLLKPDTDDHHPGS